MKSKSYAPTGKAYAVAENVAAISGLLATHKKFGKLLTAVQDSVEINRIAIEAGYALEAVASKMRINWSEGPDWMSVTEEYTDMIVGYILDPRTRSIPTDFGPLAVIAIEVVDRRG